MSHPYWDEMRPRRQSRLYALAALFLVCVAMRSQLSALPPLLPKIEADLSTTHAWGGLLTALSFTMMGFGALGVSAALRSVGSGRAVAFTTAVIALCGILRGLAPDALAVIAVGIPLGLAVGLETGLMPVIVKERFSTWAGLSTGVYVGGLSIGSSLAFATAVPIANAVGSWRGTLLVFAVVALLLIVPWVALERDGRPEVGSGIVPRLPTSSIAWLAIAIFSLQTMLFFGLNTWLPSAYVERGWAETSAGLLGSALIFTSLLGSVAVSPFASGPRWTDRFVLGSALVAVAGSFGFVFLPALGSSWTALVGLSTGALFVLSLKVPLEVANDSHEIASLAGLMLAVGYWTGGVAPVLLGALRDATGSFDASFTSLAVLSVALLVVSAWFSTLRSRSSLLTSPIGESERSTDAGRAT